jgi:hypothetical protein
MPDLLAHLGTGYAALRWAGGRRHVLLVLTGSLLPDVAWMGRRLLVRLAGFDPVEVSLWLIPWHTPYSLLLASVAAGLCARAPARATLLLAGGCALHLVLDSAQTRFGNGVLLLYPFSMRETSWRLFWPEDPMNQVLSLGSLALLGWALLGPIRHRGEAPAPTAAAPAAPVPLGRPVRIATASLCILGIAATAAATRRDVVDSNVFGLGFVTDPGAFEGRPVSLDRDRIVGGSPLEVETFSGRRFPLQGVAGLKPGEVVSLRGTLRGGTIAVEEVHIHREGLRSLYSYLGLLIFAAFALRRRRFRVVS